MWFAVANTVIRKTAGGAIAPKYFPVADFTSDTQNILVDGTVNFTDTSTVDPLGPPITQWEWTFEAGTPASSLLQNPTVTYNTFGDFDVALKVTNLDGNNTKTVPDYITVSVVPVVTDFTADTTTPFEGDTVAFTDLSTGTPDTWDWTLTGATPSTSALQNPSVVYSTAGDYTVSLTASKPGSTDTDTKIDYITVSVVPPYVPYFTKTDWDPTTNALFNIQNDWSFITTNATM
tara:strand:+ start:910 stop:1608 length:699 start_codon:yes stop_codon:yes gene_type:complete